MWPAKETTLQFGGQKIMLRPATKDKDQTICVELNGITDLEGWTLANRMLSILSWCDRNPIETAAYGTTTAVPQHYSRRPRFIGSSHDFPFRRNPEANQKARLALALYREGKTLNSTPYRFLSFFKILNIFWVDKYQGSGKKRTNPLIEGIRNALPKLKYEGSLKRVKVLKTKGHDVAEYLYKSGRCAVAHANIAPIADPDDMTDVRRLGEDMDIVEEIAENLIEVDLGVSRHVFG